MAKIAYLDKNLKADTLDLIAKMDEIVTRYQAQYLTLTLRQLYYQLVAADEIPNNQNSYNQVKAALGNARLCGLIDWDGIVDRERGLRGWTTWRDAGSYLNSVAYGLRYDHWKDQDTRVEVWVEKKALESIVTRACSDFRVDHFACKGYASLTSLHDAANRIRRRGDKGQHTTILYLGDHDPSGLDMPEDVVRRLTTFGVDHYTELHRIALTRTQIDDHRPPPNFAKLSDSRYAAYVREHGKDSWELDALDPQTLISLIRSEIAKYADQKPLDHTLLAESSDTEMLRALAGRAKEDGLRAVATAPTVRRVTSVLDSYVASGDLSQDHAYEIVGMLTGDDE